MYGHVCIKSEHEDFLQTRVTGVSSRFSFKLMFLSPSGSDLDGFQNVSDWSKLYSNVQLEQLKYLLILKNKTIRITTSMT